LNQILVVYCEEQALAKKGDKLKQFISGISCIPVDLLDDTLIISDNGDIYGTYSDLIERNK
jgi:hypothetical protein